MFLIVWKKKKRKKKKGFFEVVVPCGLMGESFRFRVVFYGSVFEAGDLIGILSCREKLHIFRENGFSFG